MKINYDEIITKANTRKEILQKISAEVEQLEEISSQLWLIKGRFEELAALWDRLDEEGRVMVGHPGRRCMASFTAFAYAINNILTAQDGGIDILLASMEETK